MAIDSDRDLTLQSGSALAAQAGTGVSIAGNGVAIDSDGNLTVQTALGLLAQIGSTVSMDVGASATIDVGGSATFNAGGAATFQAGSAFSIAGSTVRINPGSSCRPSARVGDAIAGTATPTGAVSGAIASGSGSVCVG